MDIMEDKIVLVTGSTDGIGKQTAIQLAQMGATVLIHARSLLRGQPMLRALQRDMPAARLDLFTGDLEIQYEIAEMAAAIRSSYGRLDVLVNNAGIFLPERKMTADTIEKTFAVNHLAPFLLTHYLLPLLRKGKGARIINVSSDLHYAARFDVNNLQGERGFNALHAYSNSKLCNVLFTYELASRLQNTGITVNALHPGLVYTKLFQDSIIDSQMASPIDGADTPVFLASSKEAGHITGKYFSGRAPKRTSDISYKKKCQRQLWEASEDLTMIHEYEGINV